MLAPHRRGGQALRALHSFKDQGIDLAATPTSIRLTLIIDRTRLSAIKHLEEIANPQEEHSPQDRIRPQREVLKQRHRGRARKEKKSDKQTIAPSVPTISILLQDTDLAFSRLESSGVPIILNTVACIFSSRCVRPLTHLHQPPPRFAPSRCKKTRPPPDSWRRSAPPTVQTSYYHPRPSITFCRIFSTKRLTRHGQPPSGAP